MGITTGQQNAASLAAPELQKNARSAKVAAVSFFASAAPARWYRCWKCARLASLLGQRRDHRRMRMAQCVDRDAASEVHQFSPALIPYSRTQATYRYEGCGAKVGTMTGRNRRVLPGCAGRTSGLSCEATRNENENAPPSAGVTRAQCKRRAGPRAHSRKILLRSACSFSRSAAGPARSLGPGFPAGLAHFELGVLVRHHVDLLQLLGRGFGDCQQLTGRHHLVEKTGTAPIGSNISPLITERWKADLRKRSRANSMPAWCMVMPICTSLRPIWNGPSTPMR